MSTFAFVSITDLKKTNRHLRSFDCSIFFHIGPDIDISDMLVNITIHPSVPVIDNHVLIDHQDLDLKSTFLNCSVNLNGRSDLILGYSWLKDGVYLRHNASVTLTQKFIFICSSEQH